jgi:putative tricarboxylic transport membrane protein
MSNSPDDPDAAGPRQRHVEMGVAAFILALGVITIIGSLQVGIGWGAEGPKSGFFPFWIGLLIVGTSGFNLLKAYAKPSRKLFAEWVQISQVMKIVWPMAIYVAAVPWLGIYVSSAVLIVGFMRWLGRYSWVLSLAVGLGLQVVIYVTFEKWFLLSLPKGPLEDLLGL